MLAFIRLAVCWPRVRAMVSDYALISRNDFLDLRTPLTIKWFIKNKVIVSEDITNCQKIKKQSIYLKLNNPSSHSTPGSELQDQQPQFDLWLLSSPHMQSFYLCFHKEAQITQKHDLHQFPEQKTNKQTMEWRALIYRACSRIYKGIFGVGGRQQSVVRVQSLSDCFFIPWWHTFTPLWKPGGVSEELSLVILRRVKGVKKADCSTATVSLQISSFRETSTVN